MEDEPDDQPSVPLVVVLNAPDGEPFAAADATAEGAAAGRLTPAPGGGRPSIAPD
jgi:hypothetical protein